MKGKLLALAVMISLSFGMAGVAAAEGPGGGPGDSQNQEQERAQAMAQAEECNMFAETNQAGNEFSGKYLMFRHANGTIEDYRVGGSQVQLFASVGPDPFNFSDSGADGAVAYVNGTAARFMAHNNPSSALQFRKTGGAEVRLRFELSAGLSAQVMNGSRNVMISGPVEAVVVVENGNCTVNGSRIEVALGAGDGMATVRTRTQTQSESRLQLQEKVASGGLAGEIDVVAVNGTHTQSAVGYAHSTSMMVKSAGQGKVALSVRAEYSEGKLFRIGLDRDTAGTGSAKELRCRLDGQQMKRVSVQELERLREQRSTQAAWCVEFGDRGCDILAYVPHFSEHELSVEKVAPAGDQAMPGFELALAILVIAWVLALFVAFRRRA